MKFLGTLLAFALATAFVRLLIWGIKLLDKGVDRVEERMRKK